MSATTTTYIADLTDAVNKAQAFATAYLLVESDLKAAVRAAYGLGVTGTGAGLYEGDLRREMVSFLAWLGLSDMVGDPQNAIAAQNGGSTDPTSGQVLARWTAKITALVP